MPHHRVAARDSCEIAKATRSVAKNIQILVALGQRIHQTKCQQVWQMASRRKDFIVTLNLHVLDVSPKGAPHRIHNLERSGVRVGYRGQNNFVPLEQTRI